MPDFIKDWRNAMGCIALVLAAIVTGAWIRSRVMQDTLAYSPTSTYTHFLVSRNGTLSWMKTYGAIEAGRAWKSAPVVQVKVERYAVWDVVNDFTYKSEPSDSLGDWTISYLWFSIPLTLLSAHLLFWARHANQACPLNQTAANRLLNSQEFRS